MFRKVMLILAVTLAICTAPMAFAQGQTTAGAVAGVCPPPNTAPGEYSVCLNTAENKIHIFQDGKDLGAVATNAVVASVAALKGQPAGNAVAETAEQKAPEPTPTKPRMFLVNDNMFSYSFSPYYRDPLIGDFAANKAYNIAKHVVEFKHVDVGNRFGDNTFVMSYLSSNHINPTSAEHFHDNITIGAKDVYMTYRHMMWFGQLLGKDLSKGFIKDYGITFGADFGSKNDDFSNQRRSPMVGPSVSFKVPNHGYWNLAAMWTREWNQEGTDVTEWRYCNGASTANCQPAPGPVFLQGNPVPVIYNVPVPSKWGQKIVYANTYTFQTSWGIPFALGKAPMEFDGFGVFNGSKGYGAPELTPFTGGHVWTQKGTKPETIIRPVLEYNFGSLFGEGHKYQIGIGYEYWNNLFGVDHHKYYGALQNAPFIQLKIHL